MFSSLSAWLTCSIQVKPFIKYNDQADKEFGALKNVKCYIVGGAEVVNDMNGNEVTSTTQIYYDPSMYVINPEDRVIVEGLEKDIISMTSWYDGNTGNADIKVVYL